ncbi:hypothetical protein Plhal304r1_c017g0060911 [Plasmopara halstedii]
MMNTFMPCNSSINYQKVRLMAFIADVDVLKITLYGEFAFSNLGSNPCRSCILTRHLSVGSIHSVCYRRVQQLFFAH